MTEEKNEFEDALDEGINSDIPESIVDVEKNTIYLCGPIRKVSDNGIEWREELIEDYSDTYNFVNPLDKYSPETHDILNDPIEYDEDSDKEQVLPSEYVTQDKIGILQSEYVFVGLPDVIARGSTMECMWGYLHDRPFFVWTIDEQKESGWIFDHAEVVSGDREEVMEAIENYDE